MQNVTLFDKAMSSLINVIVVFIFFLPVLLFSDMPLYLKKYVLILFFFLYKILFLFFNENRTIGMMIMKTYWKEKYPLSKQITHAFLYTASFSTLLFWVFFPFDLFLANIILLQLPSIKLRRMTFHEYLSGEMQGVKK